MKEKGHAESQEERGERKRERSFLSRDAQSPRVSVPSVPSAHKKQTGEKEEERDANQIVPPNPLSKSVAKSEVV